MLLVKAALLVFKHVGHANWKLQISFPASILSLLIVRNKLLRTIKSDKSVEAGIVTCAWG